MVKPTAKKAKTPAARSTKSEPSKPPAPKAAAPVKTEPKPVETAAPVSAAPSGGSAPSAVTKVVNLDKPNVQKAIADGLALLKDGKSKADAARLIFSQLEGESRDVVIEAFIKGATITPKGAPTYFYNVSRKAKRDKARGESKPADPPQ